MKHNSFILTCLFAIFMAMPVLADDPVYGYALFGDVPYKYTDLTGKMSLVGVGSYAEKVSVTNNVITLTGNTSLSTSRVCSDENNNIQMRSSETLSLSLTNNLEIHIKIKKGTSNSTSKFHFALCRGNNAGFRCWNENRKGYFIDQSTISSEDFTEVVLKYAEASGSDWSSAGDILSTSYPAGDIVRLQAQTNDVFEISQIYIRADNTKDDPIKPSEDDKDAPTEFSAEVKSGSVKSVEATVTVSAKDANSPITFKFYDTEEGTTPAYTTTSNSGVAKDYTITGLTPETPYTFYVEAVDPSGNATTRQTVTFTTAEQLEKRYYFFRAGDIPTIDGMTAVDLREGVGTTFQLNNMTKGSATDYVAYTLNGSWFSFNQNLKASTDMSDVKQDSWTLVVKMRTSVTDNSFNIRLNNAGECYQVSQGNLSVSAEWQELKLALADSKKTLSFSNNMTSTIFQMHANSSKSTDILDIEYAYLTNVPTNPEKPAIIDDDPPTGVNIAVKDGSLSYDRLTLQLSANDEDTPITYAVKYQIKGGGDWTEVPAFTGAQGTTVEKEITGLTPETTYTFSVVASDPNGNAAEAVTTEATTTKLAEKRYYFFRTGDLPANTDDLTCVDLRKGVGSTINIAKGSQDFQEITNTNFTKYLLGSNWCYVRVYPTSQTMDDVDGNWYLHIRYKSTHPQDVYANVAGHDKSSMKLATAATADNLWKDTVIQLDASKMTIPVAANTDAFQIQKTSNNDPVQGTFAIDYAYISNSETSVDAGYVDETAPVVTVEEKATTATAVTLTISGTDDSDSKIVYTFSDGANQQEVTKNSGETFDYTFENLTKGTEYTFTVDAKDLSNNAMTQIAKTITTPGGETKPEIQKFDAEVTPTTIKLTFNATDEDTEHQLTYNISDGTNNYQVQEMQGVDVVYTLKGLTPGTTYDLTLTATNASENTSDPNEKEVTTTYLKPSEFGVKIATVDMYNCVGHIAGDQLQTTMEYRVVTYKNYILFQHKVLGEGQSVSIGDWNNQMWVGEYPLETGRKEFAAKYNPFDSRVRLTEEQLTMDNTIGNEFDFDMYASDIFGVSGATCSQMQHFVCGYINTPSEDTEAPSIFSVNHEDKDGKRYLTIDANDPNHDKDVFYYVKEGDNEYISLQTVVVPIKSDVTYECYAVDWNGNKSEKYEVHISAATIQLADNVDNTNTINSWNSKLVNAKLTRTLSNAYYNTLCLPFGVDADQIVAVMGEGTKIAQLETARIKDNDELYLGFSFTDHIEAGVPYFVQPAQDVENPTFADVTISKTLQPTVIDGVITFQGIYNPTPLQAETDESHTILMLVADNQLTFPNVAGTLNGMRAYFNTSGSVAHVARRASFGFDGDETGLNEAQFKNDNPQTKHQKVLEHGQMLIIRQGTQYTILGQEIKK